MTRYVLACIFGAAALVASAQNGLNLPTDSPGEQRLRLGPLQLDLMVTEPGTGQRTQLFGDYYLTGPGFGSGLLVGGLRVTSGVSMGPRSSTLGMPPVRFAEGLRMATRPGSGSLAERDPERVALPYLGLGYTSVSTRDGWGFSADIGLGGLRPGERVRLGRAAPNAAQVESLLNDLRLSPVLQLGVSYAF